MTGPGAARGRPFIVVLGLAVLLVNGLALAGAAFGLSELKERDTLRAEMQGTALVQAIRQNIDDTVEKIDIALAMIADRLDSEARKSGPAEAVVVVGLMDQIRYLLKASEDVSVTDANGAVIFHMGHERPVSFSVTDRPYFQEIKAGGQTGLVVTRPIKSRLTGGDVLIFARAYHDRNGAFAGIVVMPVSLDYFRRQISAFPLKDGSFLSLRSDDLSPIVRVPEASAIDPRAAGEAADVPAALRQMIADGRDRGTVDARNLADGAGRIYAVARLSAAPIYVVHDFSERLALDQWRHLRDVTLGMVGLFLASTLLAAGMILHYWRKERLNAAELHDSNTSLRVAIQDLRELHKSILAAREVGGFGTYALDLRDDTWIRSPEQEAIFGIGPDFPRTGEAWRGLMPEDDRARLVAYFYDYACGKRLAFDLEYRIRRPSDGAMRWIHGVGKLELDDSGVPTRLIGAVKDVTEQKENHDRMAYLAYHDSLTGLPNRALLVDRIHQAMAQATRHADLLAVCYLDLDGFKPVNDRWGHEVGDRVLVEVAERLLRVTRSGDTVARMGGDEFVVLLCRLGAESELAEIAARMLAAIAQPYTDSETGIVAHLTLSMGVTLFPRDPSEEPDALLRHADQALHEAKRTGKNRLCQFDPVSDQQRQEDQAHYTRLFAALERGEFLFHYQPKVEMTTGAVAGVEALIRWQHPDRGLLLPGAFLPGLGNTDFTVPLGDWVLREALRQIRLWQGEGLRMKVCVNVFGHHLQQPDFVARLTAILDEFPEVSPADLQMEILETTAMNDLDAVTQRILDCTRLGISFALDDFGTGYSSLNYFRRLPLKFLKIDRSFVLDIRENAEDQALVESVVRLAHALDRKVVAEGVETLEHGVPLVRFGCDLAQGYGIARPMPAAEVPGWTRSWRLPDLWAEERARDAHPAPRIITAGVRRG